MAAEAQLTNWQNAIDNQFDFGKKAYLEAVPDMARANAMAQGVSGMQARLAGGMAGFSDGLLDRTQKFDGLQDAYAENAFGMNSAARQDQVANEASAGVANKFAGLRAQGLRQMSRTGVNPGSGRSLAMNNQMGISEAAAQAGAANKARQDLEMTANERQKTAIGFGASLPGQTMSAAAQASSLGNQAGTSALAPMSNRLAFAGGVSNLYGDAADGYKGYWQSQNLTPGQQAELSGAEKRGDDNFWGAVGSIAGSKAGEKLIDKGLDYLFG